MSKILVFIEQDHNRISNIGLELISEIKKQTESMEHVEIDALYLGESLHEEDKKLLIEVGTHTLYTLLDPSLVYYDTHKYSKNMIAFLKSNLYDALLLGSTFIGRDLAPRISARLHTGLTADATILEFSKNDDKLLLEATRPALGGNIFATIICPNYIPQMATVRPSVFAISFIKNSKMNHIALPLYDASDSPVELLSVSPNLVQTIELNKAPLIFAGGRGVQTKFNDLLRIADLYGIEVAASRAVVDAKVTPKSRLVGQTGQTVRPKGYVALGISGAIQHLAGMDQSELIIAVNQDPKAPIFDVAHVSYICDANEVINELIQLRSA